MTDREKLTKLLLPMVESELAGDCSSLVRGWADHLLANGVTIPVRCKECKHWQPIHEHIPHMECQIFCGAYEHGYPTNADDYCSRGERKDNETV